MPERPPSTPVRRPLAAVPCAVALALAALVPPPARSETARTTIEIRSGVATATTTLGGRSLDPGLGVGVRLSYAVTPHASVYGGLDRRDLAFASSSDATLEHQGYALGLEFHLALSGRASGVRLVAGLTHDRAKVVGHDTIGGSDVGIGWELGAAALVPLFGGWTLTPGLRYRTLDKAVAFDGSADRATFALVALEVGVRYAF